MHLSVCVIHRNSAGQKTPLLFEYQPRVDRDDQPCAQKRDYDSQVGQIKDRGHDLFNVSGSEGHFEDCFSQWNKQVGIVHGHGDHDYARDEETYPGHDGARPQKNLCSGREVPLLCPVSTHRGGVDVRDKEGKQNVCKRQKHGCFLSI